MPARKKSAKPAKAAKKKSADSIRVHCVVVEVTDLDAASSTYGKLLGHAGIRIPYGGGRHYFELGRSVLSVLDVSLDRGRKPQPNGSDLYLSVGDLRPYHTRAKKLGWLSKADVHGNRAGEITQQPWGERSFYVQDPWGNGICFVEAGTEFTGK